MSLITILILILIIEEPCLCGNSDILPCVAAKTA